MATEIQGAISALLIEDRRYAPDPVSWPRRTGPTRRSTGGRERPGGVLGRTGEGDRLDQAVRQGARLDGTEHGHEPPWAKWFVGGSSTSPYNCVDRHLKTWRRNKAAIILEGEPGDQRVLTYRDLYREVNQAAAALQAAGRQEGRPGRHLHAA